MANTGVTTASVYYESDKPFAEALIMDNGEFYLTLLFDDGYSVKASGCSDGSIIVDYNR